MKSTPWKKAREGQWKQSATETRTRGAAAMCCSRLLLHGIVLSPFAVQMYQAAEQETLQNQTLKIAHVRFYI
jgi:hypothetical protein